LNLGETLCQERRTESLHRHRSQIKNSPAARMPVSDNRMIKLSREIGLKLALVEHQRRLLLNTADDLDPRLRELNTARRLDRRHPLPFDRYDTLQAGLSRQKRSQRFVVLRHHLNDPKAVSNNQEIDSSQTA